MPLAKKLGKQPATPTPSAPQPRSLAKGAVQPKSSNIWSWPVAGTRITTQFEGTHRAIDIAVPVGTVLRAPASGEIVEVRHDNGGYGNNIRLRDSNGDIIILAHLSAFNVKPGDRVSAGQQIGLTGNTGNSTGPHLHYEIRTATGGRINPLTLPYTGKTAQALPPVGALYYPTQSQAVTSAARTTPTAAGIKTSATPPATRPESSVSTSGSNMQPMSASGPLNNIVSGALNEGIGKIKWRNVIVGGVGVIMIGIGVFGLVSSEGIKQVVKPATDQIAAALKGGGE